jgi:hypothetical protein
MGVMKNQQVCNFAVVRFLPYPETDEFVNVGVVMACPQTGLFDYRIETSQRERITSFFPELNVATLLDGRKGFVHEMDRVKTLFNKHAAPEQGTFPFDQKQFVAVFRELVRPRESVFRFGGIGTVLTDDPQQQLKHLFEYYVKRQFAQHEEYHENIMARRWKDVFRVEEILKYTEKEIGNDLYKVKIPFVLEADGHLLKAIKPLDLEKQNSTRIIEYGDKWRGRIERLRGMKRFPEEMLFVIHQPAAGKGRMAAETVCHDLEKLNVKTVNENDKDRVLNFARNAA